MVVDFKTCQKRKISSKFKVSTTQIIVGNENNTVRERKIG
jgi:hypothetical protein